MAEGNGYPFRDEPLAVELANTVYALKGEPVDGLTDNDQLTAWLAVNTERLGAAGVRPPRRREALSGDDVAAFRTLRDAMRDLFAAVLGTKMASPAAIRVVNETSARGPEYERLAWPAGAAPATERIVAAASFAEAAAAAVAADAISLLAGPRRERLRRCGAPGCVLFFVKDHPRREWCSAACGNRARLARFHQRRRAVPG